MNDKYLNPKDPLILSAESVEDWEAREAGRLAWKKFEETEIKTKNPYKPHTNSWYNWNIGWNMGWNTQI